MNAVYFVTLAMFIGALALMALAAVVSKPDYLVDGRRSSLDL
jgi:hypothetical protein